MPEMSLDLLGLHFEIGNRGREFRVPVDQPLVAIKQSVPVKLDEDPDHRRRETGVHGEALVRPIA